MNSYHKIAMLMSMFDEGKFSLDSMIDDYMKQMKIERLKQRYVQFNSCKRRKGPRRIRRFYP